MSGEPQRTPLHARHREAGARMMPFAGFEMPVSYSSIVAEHRAVRASAGIFDVSHMGEIRLRGAAAGELAQRLFSNDVSGMEPGRVRYGLLCLPDGGVVDDVTLYRVSDSELFFCVNASNIAGDLAWMREVRDESGLDCELIDESSGTALLAVQGPDARAIVASLRPADADAPRRWRFVAGEVSGVEVQLSRTGYSGEDGYEIYAPAERAAELWDRLIEAGAGRLAPAGLGARDTLRTEMGFPLYGHELDRRTTPLEAGLERFLALDREFIGREALTAQAESGPDRRLVGLLMEGRAVAREGYPIHTSAGTGSVTSGTFGPSIERSIALGYVPAEESASGTRVEIEVRGRRVAGQVTGIPFYRRKS